MNQITKNKTNSCLAINELHRGHVIQTSPPLYFAAVVSHVFQFYENPGLDSHKNIVN